MVKLTHTESVRETLDVAADPERLFQFVIAAFMEVGTVKDRSDPSWRVTGRIDGHLLAPATVSVSLSALPEGRSRLQIDSLARERFVTQHTATRAAARLLDALAANGVSGQP